MTFKEKHFKQAFGSVMFATMMMLPTGCGKAYKGNYEDGAREGLLDPTPMETKDYYGAKVTLSQVDIPIYDGDGNRLKDRWVTTRGVVGSKYEEDVSLLKTRRAYLNDNTEECYVQVDANNAILAKDGACGLFLDGYDVVVVGNESLNKHIGKHPAKLVLPKVKTAKKTLPEKTTAKWVKEDILSTDSAEKDTVEGSSSMFKDSLANKIMADTLQNNL